MVTESRISFLEGALTQTSERLRDHTERFTALAGDIQSLRAEIKAQRGEMNAGFELLRSDMNSNMESLRSEMKANMESLRSEMNANRAETNASIETLRTEMKANVEVRLKALGGLTAGR